MKNLLLRAGAIVGFGLGTFGTTLALVNHFKHTESSDQFADVNKSLESLGDSYDAVNDDVSINQGNIDKVNEIISENFDHLISAIDDSKNEIIDLFKDDLESNLKAIRDEFHAHKDSTNELITSVTTKLNDLTTKYESLDTSHQAIKDLITVLDNKYKKDIDLLKDYVGDISSQITKLNSKADVNADLIDMLNTKLSLVEEKITDIDELKSQMVSLEALVHTSIENLKTIIASGDAKNAYDIQTLQQKVVDLESVDNSLENEINDVRKYVKQVETSVTNLSNNVDLIKLDLDQNKVVDDQRYKELKTDITSILNGQGELDKNQQAIIADIKKIENDYKTLFEKNEKLETDMDYLFNQNNDLFKFVVELEQAIKRLEDEQNNFASAFVLEPNEKIYDGDNREINLPNFIIPKLNQAKNLSINIKIANSGNQDSAYIVNIANVFPRQGIDLVGTAMTLDRNQFMIKYTVKDDLLTINNLMYRSRPNFWRNITWLNGTDIYVDSVSFIY